MYSLIRRLLFRMNAESSHDLVMSGLEKISSRPALTALVTKLYASHVPQLRTRIMGIDFPNPVGLGAGLDKQASCANALQALGFGWVELGTVTPLPQAGNPRPRMFRLTSHQAMINRMGFNSIGLEAFVANLAKISPTVIKGINIGKNAATPIGRAVEDYIACLNAVFPHADYVTINISSPNTSNLRTLQQDEALDNLLSTIHQRRIQLVDQYSRPVPLVLKISPDINSRQIDAIARLLRKHQIDGVAATNTTLSRESVADHPHGSEDRG
jgi:dihydroorotate dehydrogenase